MIVLIDNYDSFTYNLYQLIYPYDNEVMVVRNDKITVKDIKALAPNGIVLSPGPGTPEEAGVCVEVIQHLSGQIPILGVCLGHQAIAVALGGHVIRSNEIVHGKSATVFHHRKNLYQHMPLPFQAGRYHSLVIDKTNLPKELQIESETANGIIMGVKHYQHPTYGVQFHPESVLSESGNILIENFISICKKGHS